MENAASCALSGIPNSLYKIAVSAVAVSYLKTKPSIRILPAKTQFDIYEKLFSDGRLCTLGYEFCNLETFLAVLSVEMKRFELHGIFQALIDHGLRLPKILSAEFCHYASIILSQNCGTIDAERPYLDRITRGLALGNFLIEASWYDDGAKCIEACLLLCQRYSDQSSLLIQRLTVEAYVWLLEAYSSYCLYEESKRVSRDSSCYVHRIQSRSFCFAELYAQYCSLFFNIGCYDESYDWALKSLQELSVDGRSDDWKPSAKTLIRVFSQISKILVVRRQYRRAELLIKSAVSLVCRHYDGGKRYPATLLDYGFYLLNMDQNEAAVQVCQLALEYRQAQFGGKNLKLAHAHEDLGYALYVMEYNTGRFEKASLHAGKALGILQSLLPNNHLLLASCQRVKALILEEIAIDSQDKAYEAALLREAEELHVSALSVCKRTFGENNIQTAKHYGNLGRLYQSLRRFEEAENMHVKSVRIKEGLLGPDDYEVALSIGHLASLYSYDLGRLDEAERLYLRSIEIGKRLFGDAYSGLEYDYRGLIYIYSQRRDYDKTMSFVNVLHDWKTLRDNNSRRQNPLSILTSPGMADLEDAQLVLEQFFKKDV